MTWRDDTGGAADCFNYARDTLAGGKNLASEASRSTSRKGGRIAVKVINHLGDEVMKVFRV